MDHLKEASKRSGWIKVLLAFFYVYLFLVGIKLLELSLKGFGIDFATALIRTTSNPFLGLFIGIISTATIQSSSATTSIVVGFVSSGILTIRNAIPIIMGANIGTTVTNTIVSFAHITRRDEFARAFPGAVVHDIFNLLNVLVFFPIEIKFHIIEKISGALAVAFREIGGIKFTSPLKQVVSPTAKLILHGFHGHYLYSLFFSFLLVVLALTMLVRVIRRASSGKLEILIDQYLFKSQLSSGLLGFGLTVFVQSSSVTTSLVVPLVGAGLLSIEKVYPYVLGANIGTTFTAILASLVTGKLLPVQAAFAHLTFNLLGILVWYPLKFIPIKAAKKLGAVAYMKRWAVVLYILAIFFLIPGTLIFIFRR